MTGLSPTSSRGGYRQLFVAFQVSQAAAWRLVLSSYGCLPGLTPPLDVAQAGQGSPVEGEHSAPPPSLHWPWMAHTQENQVVKEQGFLYGIVTIHVSERGQLPPPPTISSGCHRAFGSWE